MSAFLDTVEAVSSVLYTGARSFGSVHGAGLTVSVAVGRNELNNVAF